MARRGKEEGASPSRPVLPSANPLEALPRPISSHSLQPQAATPHLSPPLPTVISSLPILILYPHSRCNCRCVMCDIWKVTTAEEISAEALGGHLGDIRALGVEWVVFSGGEPLMHSDLFRLTSLLRDCGIRTTILTTGLLLAENAHRIVEGVDDVIVSLDGPPAVHDRIRRVPGAFARLEEGVWALRRQRGGYPIAARCTVQRENHHELRRTVATAMDLRLNSISFLAADLTSTAFNRPGGWPAEQQARVGLAVEQVEDLEAEIEALFEEFHSEIAGGFIREDESKLRRLAQHFRAHLGLAPPQAPRCNAPWVSAVIESDGTARPCFFHAPYGNVRQNSLREVVNGPEAIAFRRNLNVANNEICRRCVCSLYRPY
jgi:MoaA/NifB/PqqE/SkfB family radical SAM enzyme